MLVLVRKCDESIVIGNDIIVTVLGVDGDRVKLGIAAPREVTILRQELCTAVANENQAAADNASDIPFILPSLRRRLVGQGRARAAGG